jgi:RNA polymerase sigma-70 factor (ECF subfamily)
MSLSHLRSRWAYLRAQVTRITHRDDAEDLLHDAWVRMSEKAASVENPEAFLVRSAANGGWDAYRRERREPSSATFFETEVTLVSDQSPLQDEVLMARHRLERLRLGVEQLTPRTREVFLMHRLDGRKYREIAADLGISQSAVEKHMARAIETLADWMENW